jgi:magnesium-protoporphyrin O-methyltransferase
VSSCCQPGEYDKIFDEKKARTKARDYARKGLTGHGQRIADFIRTKTAAGYTLLEVGGGIGDLQLELLQGGAARAINIELATQYEGVAAELIHERGLDERVERRLGDFVREADKIPGADVVVMNRVVCCYPDADALVAAAADHARRYLVMTFPVDRWWTRAGLTVANVLLRIRSSGFRAYVHSTRAVLATAQHHGMRPVEHRRGFIWQLIALERSS